MFDQRQPHWWTQEYDSGWEQMKDAFQRDSDQARHDFAGDEPETDQEFTDTLGQAAGSNPIPPRGVITDEVAEFAYRFGFGARQKYGNDYPTWDEELEDRLAVDYFSANPDADDEWEEQRELIRAGWDLEANQIN